MQVVMPAKKATDRTWGGRGEEECRQRRNAEIVLDQVLGKAAFRFPSSCLLYGWSSLCGR